MDDDCCNDCFEACCKGLLIAICECLAEICCALCCESVCRSCCNGEDQQNIRSTKVDSQVDVAQRGNYNLLPKSENEENVSNQGIKPSDYEIVFGKDVGPPPPRPIHVTAVVAPVQPPQQVQNPQYPIIMTTQSAAPPRDQYAAPRGQYAAPPGQYAAPPGQYAADYIGTQQQSAAPPKDQFADAPPRYSDIHHLPSSAAGNSDGYSVPRSNTKF